MTKMPAPPDEMEMTAQIPTAILHNHEAEEAAIGAVIINPDAFYDVEFLQAEDFYIFRLRWTWEAIKDLIKRKIPIDLLTITEELSRKGQLQEIGGAPFLTALINRVPTSINAASYGRIVESYSIRRKMINAANKIAGAAYASEQRIESSIASGDAAWKEVTERGVSNSFATISIGQMMRMSYDRISAIAENGRPPGASTMLYGLDYILRGLKRGYLYTIVALSGQGKTAMLLTIARNLAKYENKKVLIFSKEMQERSSEEDPTSGGQLSSRLIGMEADIDTRNIGSATMTDDEWPKYTAAIERMSDWQVIVNDASSMTARQMVAIARKIKREQGLDVIVFDYLQIMDTDDDDKYDNREREVNAYAKSMKAAAKELNVIFLTAAQVNRAVHARADKRINAESDLRESSGIYHESDVIIVVQPDKEYKPSAFIPKEIEVQKHRDGEIGKTEEVFYHPSRTEFTNGTKRLPDENKDVRYWWQEQGE
jgi:replicative DNA helicase